MAELIRISVNLAWFKPWLHHLHCLVWLSHRSCLCQMKALAKTCGVWCGQMCLTRSWGKTLLSSFPSCPSSPRYDFTLWPCLSTNLSIDIQWSGIICTFRPSCNFLPGSTCPCDSFLARILGWFAISYFKESFQSRDQILVLLHCMLILYPLNHVGSHKKITNLAA